MTAGLAVMKPVTTSGAAYSGVQPITLSLCEPGRCSKLALFTPFILSKHAQQGRVHRVGMNACGFSG